MKTTTVLLVLLAGSLTLNYFLYQKSIEAVDTTLPVELKCDTTSGFETQTIISKEMADGFAREYKSKLTDRDSIVGGILTRTAFDEILCTSKCNAVTYTLARDSSGKTGPGGNGVFVIFSGVNVDFDNNTNQIRTYNDLGIKKYIGKRWCPPSCSPY